LDAAGTSGSMTAFANKSAWTNMHIGTASRFESEPVVDGRGYGPPPEGRTAHTFELMTVQRETTFTQPPREQRANEGAVWRPFSQLTYLVHGCRFNGRRIRIGERTYDVCERVGSFGYLIRHEGVSAANWRVSLTGRGLSEPLKGARDRVRLTVPAEEQVPLDFVVRAGREGIPPWVWVIGVLLLLGLFLLWRHRAKRV
jgi:hypothetical protein